MATPKIQMRDAVAGPALAPPWLCGYDSNAQKFMYCIGVAVDALLEKHNEGITSKFPGQGDDSFIPLQANDRLFVQGPGEPNPAFKERLKDAYNAWQRAGSRPAVLAQIQAYLTNSQPGVVASLPEVLIVGGSAAVTTWDWLNIGSPQGQQPAHRTKRLPANWNWDGHNQPWRAWMVLYMHLVDNPFENGTTAAVTSFGGSGVPGVTTGFAQIDGLAGITGANLQQYITVTGADAPTNNGTFQIVRIVSATSIIIANPLAIAPDLNNGTIVWKISHYPYIAPAPVWGSPSFVWGDGFTWGVSVSPQVITSIRQILKRWKASSTYYPNIMVSFGGADGTAGKEFSPLSVPGSGNPNGTFGESWQVVNGAMVPARVTLNPYTAFCDGSAEAIQCFKKNVT